jgi:hypothetical protein
MIKYSNSEYDDDLNWKDISSKTGVSSNYTLFYDSEVNLDKQEFYLKLLHNKVQVSADIILQKLGTIVYIGTFHMIDPTHSGHMLQYIVQFLKHNINAQKTDSITQLNYTVIVGEKNEKCVNSYFSYLHKEKYFTKENYEYKYIF